MDLSPENRTYLMWACIAIIVYMYMKPNAFIELFTTPKPHRHVTEEQYVASLPPATEVPEFAPASHSIEHFSVPDSQR